MGKTLGTRQKLSFRIEPSQRNLKPRTPQVLPSLQRSSGPPHAISDQRQRPQTVPGETPEQTPKIKPVPGRINKT
jgi:hypothetical protein